MCLICTELTKNKLTALEARRNLGEIYKTLEKEHILEILRLVWQQEDKEHEELTEVGSD